MISVISATQHSPDKFNNQNVGVVASRSKNSMSPVNKVEFVPPRVKTPPGSSTSAVGSSRNRVSQKPISGEVSFPPSASACQNGVERVEAMVLNASPRIPETEPSRRPEVV